MRFGYEFTGWDDYVDAKTREPRLPVTPYPSIHGCLASLMNVATTFFAIRCG